MLMLLRREWRDALKAGALALLWPLALATGAVWLLPAAAGAPALAALAGGLALASTARRLWRERRTGSLQRLALTPLPGATVLGARLLARATVVATQVAPAVLLAAWRRGLRPPAAGEPALPLALALLAAVLGAVLAGVAAGALVGLRARRWAGLHGSIALLVAGGWLLALPAPGGAPAGLAQANPLAHTAPAHAALVGAPQLLNPLLAAGLPLAAGAGAFGLTVALGARLLHD